LLPRRPDDPPLVIWQRDATSWVVDDADRDGYWHIHGFTRDQIIGAIRAPALHDVKISDWHDRGNLTSPSSHVTPASGRPGIHGPERVGTVSQAPQPTPVDSSTTGAGR
jgi:hypothetical protein